MSLLLQDNSYTVTFGKDFLSEVNILRVLGQGNCAVYEVEDKNSKKTLALKEILLQSAEEETLVKEESQFLKFVSVEKANSFFIKYVDFCIVTVTVNEDVEHSVAYILMERATLSLTRFVELRALRKIPIAPDEVVFLAEQCSKAFAFLQEQHIAHADIKPENILLQVCAEGEEEYEKESKEISPSNDTSNSTDLHSHTTSSQTVLRGKINDQGQPNEPFDIKKPNQTHYLNEDWCEKVSSKTVKVKICDIGSAVRHAGGEIGSVRISSIEGTIPFLAPELIKQHIHKGQQGKYNPFKSDVFSFGLCVLFLATQQRFFKHVRLCIDEQTYSETLQEWCNLASMTMAGNEVIMNILYSALALNYEERPDFITLDEKIQRFIKDQQSEHQERELEEQRYLNSEKELQINAPISCTFPSSQKVIDKEVFSSLAILQDELSQKKLIQTNRKPQRATISGRFHCQEKQNNLKGKGDTSVNSRDIELCRQSPGLKDRQYPLKTESSLEFQMESPSPIEQQNKQIAGLVIARGGYRAAKMLKESTNYFHQLKEVIELGSREKGTIKERRKISGSKDCKDQDDQGQRKNLIKNQLLSTPSSRNSKNCNNNLIKQKSSGEEAHLCRNHYPPKAPRPKSRNHSKNHEIYQEYQQKQQDQQEQNVKSKNSRNLQEKKTSVMERLKLPMICNNNNQIINKPNLPPISSTQNSIKIQTKSGANLISKEVDLYRSNSKPWSGSGNKNINIQNGIHNTNNSEICEEEKINILNQTRYSQKIQFRQQQSIPLDTQRSAELIVIHNVTVFQREIEKINKINAEQSSETGNLVNYQTSQQQIQFSNVYLNQSITERWLKKHIRVILSDTNALNTTSNELGQMMKMMSQISSLIHVLSLRINVQSKTIKFLEDLPEFKDESTPNTKILLEQERGQTFIQIAEKINSVRDNQNILLEKIENNEQNIGVNQNDESEDEEERNEDLEKMKLQQQQEEEDSSSFYVVLLKQLGEMTQLRQLKIEQCQIPPMVLTFLSQQSSHLQKQLPNLKISELSIIFKDTQHIEDSLQFITFLIQKSENLTALFLDLEKQLMLSQPAQTNLIKLLDSAKQLQTLTLRLSRNKLKKEFVLQIFTQLSKLDQLKSLSIDFSYNQINFPAYALWPLPKSLSILELNFEGNSIDVGIPALSKQLNAQCASLRELRLSFRQNRGTSNDYIIFLLSCLKQLNNLAVFSLDISDNPEIDESLLWKLRNLPDLASWICSDLHFNIKNVQVGQQSLVNFIEYLTAHRLKFRQVTFTLARRFSSQNLTEVIQQHKFLDHYDLLITKKSQTAITFSLTQKHHFPFHNLKINDPQSSSSSPIIRSGSDVLCESLSCGKGKRMYRCLTCENSPELKPYCQYDVQLWKYCQQCIYICHSNHRFVELTEITPSASHQCVCSFIFHKDSSNSSTQSKIHSNCRIANSYQFPCTLLLKQDLFQTVFKCLDCSNENADKYICAKCVISSCHKDHKIQLSLYGIFDCQCGNHEDHED